MLEVYKTLIGNQYEAAFRTLQHCVEQCTDEALGQPVCNVKFCQAMFHGLFFADVYLGADPNAVEQQEFHSQHAEEFAGYEEWEDRPPEKEYSRDFIQAYLDHCRQAAQEIVAEMTESILNAPSGFPWIKGTTAEVHVYNIRHIQHHAAQMSLRLRLDSQVNIPWVKSGWED